MSRLRAHSTTCRSPARRPAPKHALHYQFAFPATTITRAASLVQALSGVHGSTGEQGDERYDFKPLKKFWRSPPQSYRFLNPAEKAKARADYVSHCLRLLV